MRLTRPLYWLAFATAYLFLAAITLRAEPSVPNVFGDVSQQNEQAAVGSVLEQIAVGR